MFYNDLVASDDLQFKFMTDGDGNYGYRGADGSFIPFKSGENSINSFLLIGAIAISLNNANERYSVATSGNGYVYMLNDGTAYAEFENWINSHSDTFSVKYHWASGQGTWFDVTYLEDGYYDIQAGPINNGLNGHHYKNAGDTDALLWGDRYFIYTVFVMKSVPKPVTPGSGNAFEEFYTINVAPYSPPYTNCAGYSIMKDGTFNIISSGTPVASVFTEDKAFRIYDDGGGNPVIYTRKAGYYTHGNYSSGQSHYNTPTYYAANTNLGYFHNQYYWVYYGETNPFA